MKCLIIEDDAVSRLMLQKILSRFGQTHDVSDGSQGIIAFKLALSEEEPYDLICLDIMMPGKDGHEVLRELRAFEESHGIQLGDGAKVIMTTALDDRGNILGAFDEACDAYLVKPIDTVKLISHLQNFGLHPQTPAAP